MTKIARIHYHRAQRIYDRLGRGSVADIDAIAQALAEAERGGERKGIREGKRQAAEIARLYAEEVNGHTEEEAAAIEVASRILAFRAPATITDEAE